MCFFFRWNSIISDSTCKWYKIHSVKSSAIAKKNIPYDFPSQYLCMDGCAFNKTHSEELCMVHLSTIGCQHSVSFWILSFHKWHSLQQFIFSAPRISLKTMRIVNKDNEYNKYAFFLPLQFHISTHFRPMYLLSNY